MSTAGLKVGEKTIVKYSPKVNNFVISALNEKELDLFIALITQMKDEKNTMQTIHMNRLKELLGLTYKGKRLFEILKKSLVNLSSVKYINTKEVEELETLEIRQIFSVLKLTMDKKNIGNSKINIKMSDDAVGLVNDLERYVLFDLREFTSIKGKFSKSAKILYKLLKQFRTTGMVKISLEKYRIMLGIGDNLDTKEINRTYLKEPMKKLIPYFENLKVEKETDSLTRKITGYTFTFSPEKAKKQYPKFKNEYKERPINSHKEIATDWSKYQLNSTKVNSVEFNKNSNTLTHILSQLEDQELNS